MIDRVAEIILLSLGIIRWGESIKSWFYDVHCADVQQFHFYFYLFYALVTWSILGNISSTYFLYLLPNSRYVYQYENAAMYIFSGNFKTEYVRRYLPTYSLQIWTNSHLIQLVLTQYQMSLLSNYRGFCTFQHNRNYLWNSEYCSDYSLLILFFWYYTQIFILLFRFWCYTVGTLHNPFLTSELRFSKAMVPPEVHSTFKDINQSLK